MVVSLRKVNGSPLEVSTGAATEELREAMADRNSMINAIFDIATATMQGAKISEALVNQAVAAAQLLNEEVDAMEKILVEY